jgi:hypothetical protein
MQVLGQMRGSLYGQMRTPRLRADKTEAKQRLCARCAPVGYRTRAPASKSSGKNSGSISPQSLMNLLLCRSAEAGF